eukprot:6059709-Amphidinium_carterae.1
MSMHFSWVCLMWLKEVCYMQEKAGKQLLQDALLKQVLTNPTIGAIQARQCLESTHDLFYIVCHTTSSSTLPGDMDVYFFTYPQRVVCTCCKEAMGMTDKQWVSAINSQLPEFAKEVECISLRIRKLEGLALMRQKMFDGFMSWTCVSVRLEPLPSFPVEMREY